MSDEKTQVDEGAKDFEGHQLGDGAFEPQLEEDFEGHQLGDGMFEPQLEEQLEG